MKQDCTRNNLNLQQTVRFFETLLRASADGIVIIDPAKNIIFVNDAFCKFFSGNRQDVIETNLFTWLSKLDSNAKDIWNGLENQIKEHDIAQDVGFTMKTGEGMRYFSVNSSLLEKIDNVDAGLIISIWRDDTQNKMAKGALERAHDDCEMRVKEKTAQLNNINISLKNRINEHRRAMETLQESEGKYRRLFEYSNDIILYVDKFGKVLDVNNKLKEVLGFSPEDVIGRYFFTLGIIRMKDLPRIVELFKRTVRKGMTMDKAGRFLDKVEMELRAKNGNLIYVETSTTVLKKDGKIDGFLTNIRDITERKHAEEELRIKDIVFESALVANSITDNKGIITNMNSAFLKLWGYSTKEEAIGHSLASFFANEPDARTLFEALNTVGTWEGEFFARRADGSTFISRGYATVVRDEIGNQIGYYSANIDVTEERRDQEMLRESERKYRNIIETTNEGVWVLDASSKTIYVNSRIAQMLGYAPEEMLGKHLFDFMDPNACHDAESYLENRKKGIKEDHDFRFSRKNGTDLWAIVSTSPIIDDKGQYVGALGLITDISEHKKVEKALHDSLEEKTVLLNEIHHRVKNNLQIVSSLLNLQAMRTMNKEALETLRETGNRIRSMAMLHETLYRSGNMAQVDFPAYIENICAHIVRSYDSKAGNIKLELHLAEIVIDLDQAVSCGLIINELVSNALKHAFPAGRKGRITVEMQSLPEDRIMLIVSDDGIGLPQGLDINQSETLGLKLVSMLTEKLKGNIEIIRDAGTAFHIQFKVKTDKEELR